MTIPLPNLDDRTFDDLVEEAVSLIPVEYPEWTDRNPSDTGIILIELLAWLTEMVLYRVNQIPDQNIASFLSLLKGEQLTLPNVSGEKQEELLKAEIQETLSELRKRYRAVTSSDFERLVLEDWNQTEAANSLTIARAKCLPQRDLEHSDTETFAKGHISLVVLPQENSQIDLQPLFTFLDERRLLTTRLHIVLPEYISVKLEATLFIEDEAKPENVEQEAIAEIMNFFAPLQSGKYWQGKGWHFGRNIYLSELYQLLDEIDGVDYVENLYLKDEYRSNQTSITLLDNQLVDIKSEDIQITVVVQVGNEQKQL